MSIDSDKEMFAITRPSERPFVIEDAEYITVADGSGHYVKLPSLTTAQRDGLSPSNGTLIYNSNTFQVEAYQNGAWGAITGGGVSTTLASGISSGVTVIIPSGQFMQIFLPIEYYTNGISVSGVLQVDGGFLFVGL